MKLNLKGARERNFVKFSDPTQRAQGATWSSPWGPQRALGAPQGVQRGPQDRFRIPILYIQTPDEPQSARYMPLHAATSNDNVERTLTQQEERGAISPLY